MHCDNLTALMLLELLLYKTYHVSIHSECLILNYNENLILILIFLILKIFLLLINKFAWLTSNLFISNPFSFCFFQINKVLEQLLH